MTDKQRKFCDEYLIDLNATRAYKSGISSCKIGRCCNVRCIKIVKKC
ncbi:MAG: terminase small subunit [Lachnospirales bacterium]